MKVVVYPADNYGCGHYRMIWPGNALAAAGHDVHIVRPEDRSLQFHVMSNHRVVSVELDPEVDVVVFQRVTHFYLMQAVTLLRERGVAVVIDVDDDLNSIHPDNPAWWSMHPRHFGAKKNDGTVHMHSWRFLNTACTNATLVTASTSSLIAKYAPHGRGVVVPNYLPNHHYDVERSDNDDIVWPASLHSHPNDPAAVGNAVSRLVAQGAVFASYGDPRRTARAFGLNEDDFTGSAPKIEIGDWPVAIARSGIGICPLADTKFNESKSWVKPLELSGAGVPWVASPRTEYQRLHKLGCGVLADKPKDWYKTLGKLRRDVAWRAELSVAGREVAETLRIRDHAWRWLEVWDDALKIQRSDSLVISSV